MLEGLRRVPPLSHRPLTSLRLSPSLHFTTSNPPGLNHALSKLRHALARLWRALTTPPSRAYAGALWGVVNVAICGPLPASGRRAASSRPLLAWDRPSNRLLAAAAREEGAAVAAGTGAQTDPAWTAEMLGVAAGMTNRYGHARALRPAAARASTGQGPASGPPLPPRGLAACGWQEARTRTAQARGGRGLRGPAELSCAA